MFLHIFVFLLKNLMPKILMILTQPDNDNFVVNTKHTKCDKKRFFDK